MISLESAPILLLAGLSILSLVGLSVLAWGNRIPGKGIWMVWIGLMLLFGIIVINSGLIPQIEFQKRVWLAGWIWPRSEIGALTLGIFQEPLGLVMAGLSTLLCSLSLLNRNYFATETHNERVYAALLISTAGVVLSWNSSTPWLALIGILLSILGGFISFSSRWHLPNEATAATQFARVRAAGLLLAFLGACILATSRTALLFDQPGAWAVNVSGGNFESTWLGSILLVAGLFIQMLSFPLLSWAVSSSDVYTPVKSLLTQIYPAWASFALLIRLYPQFEALGLFPVFGWVALLCSALTSLSGLFQKEFHAGLRVWLASGLALATALLAFGGPLAGLGTLLGVSLGVFSLAGIGVELQKNPEKAGSAPKSQVLSLKFLAVLSLFAATGGVGFVSSNSGIRWILAGLDRTTEIPFQLFSLFLSVLLGSKLLWRVIRAKNVKAISWFAFIPPGVGVLLSLGVFWTGSPTSDVFATLPDRVLISLFEIFFSAKAALVSDLEPLITAFSLYWGTLILGLLAGYWFSGLKEDRWAAFATSHPKLSQFLRNGYETDILIQKIVKVIGSLGHGLEKIIDLRIWMEWIPQSLLFSVRFLARLLNRMDEVIFSALGRGLHFSVDFPARCLQLIQTGDLRWYFVFVFGSSFVVILQYFYFLKK